MRCQSQIPSLHLISNQTPFSCRQRQSATCRFGASKGKGALRLFEEHSSPLHKQKTESFKKRNSVLFEVVSQYGELLLAVYFIRYGELLTAFGTTRSQNATAVCSGHTLTETMLVVSLAIVGLERSFHFLYRYYCCSVQCSRIRHSDSKISKKISFNQTFVLLSAQ